MASSLPDPDPDLRQPLLPGVPPGARIYAQLLPDDAGLAHLGRLQSLLRAQAPRTRPVTRGRLHLTLIHFGRIEEAFDRLSVATGVQRAVFGRALAGYLHATAAALPAGGFLLEPEGLAGFGRDGSTLAVEYAATARLDSVHRTLYGLLLDFLAACGAEDPAGYAARDPALAFASRLHPHISLLHGFHGYTAQAPEPDLQPVRLTASPVLFRS